MALIDCPSCSKQVSDAAPACPSCGHPIAGSPARRPRGKSRVFAALLNLLAPGVGYAYAGRFRAFELMLLIGTLLTYLDLGIRWDSHMNEPMSVGVVGGMLVGVAFAYDAFKLAEKASPAA